MVIQDNEAVYDTQINPLMGQIIALCKEHGIDRGDLLAAFGVSAYREGE